MKAHSDCYVRLLPALWPFIYFLYALNAPTLGCEGLVGMHLTEEHVKLLPCLVTDASVADCGGVPVPVTYSSSDRPKAVSGELSFSSATSVLFLIMINFLSSKVKAVKLGHILVVDEADKAPTNVTCILKTLVENGEMILADGRRIVAGEYWRGASPPRVGLHLCVLCRLSRVVLRTMGASAVESLLCHCTSSTAPPFPSL